MFDREDPAVRPELPEGTFGGEEGEPILGRVAWTWPAGRLARGDTNFPGRVVRACSSGDRAAVS